MFGVSCETPFLFLSIRDVEPPSKDDDDDGGGEKTDRKDLSLEMPMMKRNISSDEEFETLYTLSAETETFTCLVCMDDNAKFEEGFAMQCGHWACVDCWMGYISSFVNDGAYCTCALCQGTCHALVNGFDLTQR